MGGLLIYPMGGVCLLECGEFNRTGIRESVLFDASFCCFKRMDMSST